MQTMFPIEIQPQILKMTGSYLKLLQMPFKFITRDIKVQKDLEEMHKVKEDFAPIKPYIEEEGKEENRIIDTAMNLIDEAEKLVKNYEINIKTDVLLYESPYDKAISYYNEAKKLFQEIGWNDEAIRLIDTVKFYKEKKEKDEK